MEMVAAATASFALLRSSPTRSGRSRTVSRITRCVLMTSTVAEGGIGMWNGGDGGAEVCRWEEALSDGTIPGLHMLSESAARLSGDADKAEHDSTTPNDRQPPSCQI